jgi:PAS domain S-box-containing protein
VQHPPGDATAPRQSDNVEDESLRVLFERSSDAIFVARPDGALTAVNPAACRLIDYTHAELLGMNARDLVAPEWLDLVDQHAHRQLAGLEREALYELAFVDRAGHRIPVEMRSTILELDGETVGIHAVVRDIRERHRARAALAESEQRFQSAFDAPLVGMAVASLDRRLLKVNNALCRMLAHTEADLLAGHLDDLAHPDDAARLAVLNLTMLEGEIASYQAPARLRRSSGNYAPVQLSVSILRDIAGQPAYTIAQVVEQTRLEHEPNRDTCPLTLRERQVLTHLANGDSTAETAAALAIGHDTVHTYVRRATRKLGARTRTQTIVKAATSGWLNLGQTAP